MIGTLLLLVAGMSGDTTRYAVLNHGRPAGEMTVVNAADSTVLRYRHVDRNRGVHVHTSYRFAPDGSPRAVRSWSLAVNDTGPAGPPTATLVVHGDSVEWNDERLEVQPGTYYWMPQTSWDAALLARYLLRQPDRTARMRTGARVRLEIVSDTVIDAGSGPERLRMVALHVGENTTPTVVWLDEKDDLFASQAAWFIAVRAGAEHVLDALRAPELTWRRSVAEEMARRVPAHSGTIAIVDGDVFDAERGMLLLRTSVLIVGDRITAVGPRASLRIPRDATIIDARGRTVLPGMWEMHGHQSTGSGTGSSVEQLARGITTVRDLAADLDIAVAQRDAADAGRVLSPRLVLGGFIEGPGAWAGPSEAIAGTEAEARAWVARYDSLGYTQVKLYNLVHPDLVPAIVAEARSRGMRVSGHVPRGLSLPAFVRLGADEINHAAFFFSTFFPDSLYVPEMRAYSAVATQVAASVDVDGPAMTEVIELLREHGTVVDGTFSIWIREPGQGGPNVTGLPAAVADSLAEASNASYLRLIRRLYDAGVTMVPGTDAGGGRRYIAELQSYERAGVPPAYVLQMATLTSARVMGEDSDYGSIAPGKVADIVIVDGRPLENLEALESVEYVIRAGRVYRSSDLLEAVGMRRNRVTNDAVRSRSEP